LGRLYAIGGIHELEDGTIKSLNSCETYDIENDKWDLIPALKFARSHHTICTFNDKFLFVFGGRTVNNGRIIKN